jgi:inhibitor of cysteine peptidase
MSPGWVRIASIALVAGVASCASIRRDEVAAPPDGGSVAMRTGTPLVVSLPADPDIGYGWVLRSASPNLALIGGPDYTPQPRPPGLVGVANTTAYRFRATAPGSGTLEFVWVAPPGQPPAPDRVVRYDVQITPTLPLVTDFLGTKGLQSARGGAYAPASDAAPATTSTTPDSPASSESPADTPTPGSVKYWSF